MKVVKFDPELLPNYEKLIYKPTLFATKGEVKIIFDKIKRDWIEVKVFSNLSFYGGAKISELESTTIWQHLDENWELSEYQEENKRNKTNKSWKKTGKNKYIDPASLFFCFRHQDLFKKENISFDLFISTQRELEIKLSIIEIEERVFTFLGNRPRRQVAFTVESDFQKHKKEAEYLRKSAAKVWLDRKTGIPTEMSFKAAVIGTIGLRLVDRKAEN